MHREFPRGFTLFRQTANGEKILREARGGLHKIFTDVSKEKCSMKNLLYIVIVAAISLFTASAPKETVLPSAPSGAFARIESGRTLAVQNGFTVSFSGEDGFIKRLELRSPYVIRPGRCGFSKRFIFMPDKCFGIIRRGDVWQPSGCAVFDHSGNVVREY